MNMRKSLLILFAVLLALISPLSAMAESAAYDPTYPFALSADHLNAQSALVIDGTGRVLFTKNPDARMSPASTTKIMTLLLACEYGHLDEIVTVPKEAAEIAADSSVVPVTPGEQMPFIDLLYGLELHSGNDAANAIAVIVGGSISDFVSMMNARAREIGMTNTSYSNAHGLTDAKHYTTATDMAKLAIVAMQNETFRKIVSTSEYEMSATELRGPLWLTSTYDLYNPLSDLYYENCIGIKSGFTSHAGQCFVGAAEQNDLLLISVALNCSSANDAAAKRTKFIDTTRLLDYGFSQYDEYNFAELFELATANSLYLNVIDAHQNDPYGGQLTLMPSQLTGTDLSTMVYGEQSAIDAAVAAFRQNLVINIEQNVVAPVINGQTLGTISYSDKNGNTMSGVLIASRGVEAQSFWYKLSINPIFRALVIILAVLAVLIIILRIRVTIRRNRRRKIAMERRRRELERYRQEQRSRGKW
ncbi:MAG: D-alanyl-D-alanine carboxypeptidase [Clostridiales bacterium]|nr:D-alanyl-D-alanine carboxypeptidase [Clostridiales bacterium]